MILGIVPFTENTKKARELLENMGFTPLKYFQGGEFVYSIISTRTNKNRTWIEKNYSTFNSTDDINIKPFLESNASSLQEFIIKIKTLSDDNFRRTMP